LKDDATRAAALRAAAEKKSIFEEKTSWKYARQDR